MKVRAILNEPTAAALAYGFGKALDARSMPLTERRQREAPAQVIELLNARQADAIDLHMQTRQAHWNVKGPNFIALHELFAFPLEESPVETENVCPCATAVAKIASAAATEPSP